MRHLKLFGAPLLCGLIAMAVLGVGTAQATRLCSTNTSPCPVEKRWLKATPIAAQLEVPTTIVTNITTITCQKSPLEGETTSDGGGGGVSVTGTIKVFELKECTTAGGTACTVEIKNLPYGIEFSWTAGFNGTEKISPDFKLSCGAILVCRFTAPGTLLPVTGGGTAKATATQVVLSREGGLLCPKEAKWNAIYEFLSPGPLYLTNE